jgi:hypothetical protein
MKLMYRKFFFQLIAWKGLLDVLDALAHSVGKLPLIFNLNSVPSEEHCAYARRRV